MCCFESWEALLYTENIKKPRCCGHMVMPHSENFEKILVVSFASCNESQSHTVAATFKNTFLPTLRFSRWNHPANTGHPGPFRFLTNCNPCSVFICSFAEPITGPGLNINQWKALLCRLYSINSQAQSLEFSNPTAIHCYCLEMLTNGWSPSDFPSKF